MAFLAARRILVLASVVGAALVMGAPDARGQGPARTPGTDAESAVALDVSLEHHGEQTRVIVLLDRAVDVVEQNGPARVVFRMAGARAGGRRRPVVAPDDEGPVVRVGLVPAGRDLDLVIDVRRTVTVTRRLVEVGDGFELRIDLGDVPGRRPPAPVVTSAPAPEPTRARALPTAGRPAAAPAPREAAEAPRTLGGHTFLTPARGPSPFVTTHLALSIGFEHARFPRVDGRERTPYRAALGALSLRLELGVRVLPRLGLVVAGGGLLASGFDGKSALDLGADGGGFWLVGIEGVPVRIASTGTQVGARLSAEGTTGGRITSITRLFDQATATRQAPSTSDLFASESSVAGRFAWSVAQAIGPHASAQAWIGWATSWAASSGSRTEHAVDLTGGFALTADASPRAPVAILVEYDGDAIVSGSRADAVSPSAMLSERGTSSFLAGLYYSGRRDLLLGGLGGAELHGVGPARWSGQGRLVLGYFF